AVIDKAGKYLSCVGRNLRIAADQPVDLARVESGRQGWPPRPARPRNLAKIPNDLAGDGQRMAVIPGDMVGDAAQAAMHQGPAERFGIHHLARGGEGELRAAEVHEALLLDDHYLVAKRRYVGPACGARPQNHSDLLDALG